MTDIVGVRFRRAGKIYYFASNNLTLNIGDGVIVETARGREYGSVVIHPDPDKIEDKQEEYKPVVRKATMRDMAQLERNKEREKAAYDICLEKIKKLNCPMRLLRVEYTFDRNKIVFFFTADGRVDFRELVKELAAVFHTRIELRQVGIRDKAKQVSGIGVCGRVLCCSTFLGDFAPVSIKMAKNQGISLNPSKISGACGRLMCCLRFENDLYKGPHAINKACPANNKNPAFKIGMKVATSRGTGRVLYVNLQQKTVKVQLEGNKIETFPWDQVKEEKLHG